MMISGKGTPIVLARNTKCSKISSSSLPTVEEAVENYEREGGKLTRKSSFGIDPLQSCPELQEERLKCFNQQYGNVELIFQNVLRDNGLPLLNAILYFHAITQTLANY